MSSNQFVQLKLKLLYFVRIIRNSMVISIGNVLTGRDLHIIWNIRPKLDKEVAVTRVEIKSFKGKYT